MDRLQRVTEEQSGFFITRGPARFTLGAQPENFELRIDQHDGFLPSAPGARDVMFVQNTRELRPSLHTQRVGPYTLKR